MESGNQAISFGRRAQGRILEEGTIVPLFGDNAEDNIQLTDGKHRTLCVSRHLPDSLMRADGQWSLDQFEMLDELYRGKTSLLHKAVDKASGLVVAIKQYRKRYLSALNRYQVMREIRIQISMQHRHIITLHAAFEDPEQVYLVQEFAPGGDLFEALKHQPSMVFNEATAVARFMAPCLDALVYLQDRGIIHRDIKPENILLGKAGDVKLADFGLAINYEQERPVTRAGTLDYMAPEILVCPDKRRPEENKDKASLSYGRQVDAWALGCLAAELVTGSPPFEADTRSATYQMIMYREPKLPAYLSTAAKSFIAASLEKNPCERTTVYQMQLHQWIISNRNACVAADSAQPGLEPGTQQSAVAVTTSDGFTTTQGVVGSTSSEGSSSVNTVQNSNAGSSAFGGSGASEGNSLVASAAAAQFVSTTDTARILDTMAAEPGISVGPAAMVVVSETHVAPNTYPPLVANTLVTDVASNTTAQQTLEDSGQAGVIEPADASGLPAGNSAACQGQPFASVDVTTLRSAAVASDSVVFSTSTLATTSTATTKHASCPAAYRSAIVDGGIIPLAITQVATDIVATDIVATDIVAADVAADIAAAPPSAGSTHHRSGKATRHPASRPSSIHGHRLHRVFYPHDKHRRSSYSNIQWDDLIDTASAHSFTSSVHSAAAGESDEELSAAAAGGGASSAVAADQDSSDEDRSHSTPQRMIGSPLRRGQSLLLGGLNRAAVQDNNFSVQGSGNSSIGQRLGYVSRQISMLAALPDADMQASAAVRSDVMAKTASGALHLLASNDLEDLISPTVTSSRTLTTLGLSVPADNVEGPVTPGSLLAGRSRSVSAFVDGNRNESGSAAAAAVDTLLNNSNFEDFIATSASPSSRTSHSFVVASSGNRSNSVPDLVALAASKAAPSASASSKVDAAGYSSTDTLASPRTRHASLSGTTAVPQRSGNSPTPPAGGRSKRASAVAGSILATAGSLSDSSEGPAKPFVQNRLGVLLNLVTEELDGDGVGLGYRTETPNGSRRVIWADAPRVAGKAEVPANNSPRSTVAAAGSSQSTRQANSTTSRTDDTVVPVEMAQQQQTQYYAPPTGVLSVDGTIGARGRPPGGQLAAGSSASRAGPAGASSVTGNWEISMLPNSPPAKQKQALAAASPAIQHHSSREAASQVSADPSWNLGGRRRISSSDGGISSHTSYQASKRSSSDSGTSDKQHCQPGSWGRSGSGAADRQLRNGSSFTAAVSIAAPGGGLSRNSINSRTLPSQLQLPSGGDGDDSSADADMIGLVSARRTSQSFTAGVPGHVQPAAGRRSSGALTPTRTIYSGSILGGANLKDSSIRSRSLVDMASLGKQLQ